jgi:hypothetical protein
MPRHDHVKLKCEQACLYNLLAQGQLVIGRWLAGKLLNVSSMAQI